MKKLEKVSYLNVPINEYSILLDCLRRTYIGDDILSINIGISNGKVCAVVGVLKGTENIESLIPDELNGLEIRYKICAPKYVRCQPPPGRNFSRSSFQHRLLL